MSIILVYAQFYYNLAVNWSKLGPFQNGFASVFFKAKPF